MLTSQSLFRVISGLKAESGGEKASITCIDFHCLYKIELQENFNPQTL